VTPCSLVDNDVSEERISNAWICRLGRRNIGDSPQRTVDRLGAFGSSLCESIDTSWYGAGKEVWMSLQFQKSTCSEWSLQPSDFIWNYYYYYYHHHHYHHHHHHSIVLSLQLSDASIGIGRESTLVTVLRTVAHVLNI